MYSNRAVSVNANKTDLMLFTRKRRLSNFRLPRMSNTVLTPSNGEVSVVTLDRTLTWTQHTKNKTENAFKFLWACRWAFGVAWGLCSQIVCWLYTNVVRHSLIFPCAWYVTMKATVECQLDKVLDMWHLDILTCGTPYQVSGHKNYH